MALTHVAGALFAWFLLGIVVFAISAWETERVKQLRLQDAAIALGVSLSTLESDESLVPRLVDYSAQRFSSELLRNRLSDLCGTVRTCWNWLGSLVQIGLIAGIAWAMYSNGRDQSVYMWSVLPVSISFWVSTVVFSFACLLLTGRYPGEARSARKALTAHIEHRMPNPGLETRAAPVWAVLSGVTSLIAFVMVFVAGEKGHPTTPVYEQSSHLPTINWSTYTPPPVRPVVSNPEVLADSTRTALSAANYGSGPPVPQFAKSESRLAYLKWLNATSAWLAPTVSDELLRRELLQTVWFESRRAGLEPAVVVAAIQVASGFNPIYTSATGERGLMAVAPKWSALIGDGDTKKLFHRQVNLRFGCVLLRYFLDQKMGDLESALADYRLVNLPDDAPILAGAQFAKTVLEAAKRLPSAPTA